MNTNTTRAFAALVTAAALYGPGAALANTTATAPATAASATVSATAPSKKTPTLVWAGLATTLILMAVAVAPKGTMSKPTTPPPYDD